MTCVYLESIYERRVRSGEYILREYLAVPMGVTYKSTMLTTAP